MRGDQCPYSHASQPAAKAKATSSTSAFGAKVPGAVAILTSTLTAAVASSSCTCLEFVGDAGAGECLGSVEAFRRQGLELPDDLQYSHHVHRIFSLGAEPSPGIKPSVCGVQNLSVFITCTCCPTVPLRFLLASCVSKMGTLLYGNHRASPCSPHQHLSVTSRFQVLPFQPIALNTTFPSSSCI